MSVFLVHGFGWARNDVRVFVVLKEVDDAAPNNLMSGESEEAMNEVFRKLYPGPMADLFPLRFIEPLNPNNEKFKYPSEPYVFVSDVVVQSEDFIDVTQAMSISIRPAQWEALAELRDQIAPKQKIGWYVVHNGDPAVAQQERLGKAENGIDVNNGPTRRLEEEAAIESKFSQGLNEQIGEQMEGLQLHDGADGRGSANERQRTEMGEPSQEQANWKPSLTGGNRNPLPAYSPARPPAVPLAVRSPYTSAWSSTSMNGTLNTNGAIFWWVTASQTGTEAIRIDKRPGQGPLWVGKA
ncbi:MAG: hypothetical protein Q9219_003841 [cf. Caloplaca sp. 3 TL-2023]